MSVRFYGPELDSEQFSPEYAQENAENMINIARSVSEAANVPFDEMLVENYGQFLDVERGGSVEHEHLGPADGREKPSKRYLVSTNTSPYTNTMGIGENGKVPKDAKTIEDFMNELEENKDERLVGISEGEYKRDEMAGMGFAPPRPRIQRHSDSSKVHFVYIGEHEEHNIHEADHLSLDIEFGPNTHSSPEPGLGSTVKSFLYDETSEEIEKEKRKESEPSMSGKVRSSIEEIDEEHIAEELNELEGINAHAKYDL